MVGPPGTGKTDTAVQIISNIYNNFPNQRVLLVTHSNQALNDIFEKIAKLNIHERHLLRLGHDADKLDTEEDFSKWGRVQFMLGKRLELLQEVAPNLYIYTYICVYYIYMYIFLYMQV